jgi:iron(III) transport system ATP-binding protein
VGRISLKGLTKKFGSVTACDSIDLEVGDGEFLSLLGPSGCGKTTTLQLLAGFLVPDGGEIRLDDRLISSPGHVMPPERREMSMIFQSYAIWPHKTVFGNVAFGLQLRHYSADQVRRKVGDILEMMRLGPLKDRYPAELSGGQQQRVALARALVVEPKTLLLDEPLSNLDANLREEMRFLIRSLHQEVRKTMIYVTHDQAEAMVTSDRIAVMNAGRIDQLGTPAEIYESPRTQFVATFIGRTNLIPGRRAEGGMVQCEQFSLRTADANGRPGESVIVCVRPHRISMEPLDASAASPGAPGENVMPGRVRRATYLGESRDYLVQVGGTSLMLRVQTAGSQAHGVDTEVLLRVPAQACLIVQPST